MIRDNLDGVRQRIARACRRCGRDPSSVTLVAVTKGVSVEAIREAVALGVTDVGENRVQEARIKKPALGPMRWHLIGHLQSNKVKAAVELFDAIHSVDSLALVDALERATAGHKLQKVFVQVNVSGEATKFGCRPEEARALVQAVLQAPHLQFQGLMTMAPYAGDPEIARPHFRGLRQLRDDVVAVCGLQPAACSLSMGMSGDFEVAVEEGADIVRIGTAIFVNVS